MRKKSMPNKKIEHACTPSTQLQLLNFPVAIDGHVLVVTRFFG